VATPANGSASIAFTAGADGGAAITKYQYQLGSGSWTDAVGTTSPITISGLTNGTNSSIKLRAVNSAGDGAASDAVSVTPRTKPAAPTSLVATAGVGSASIAFTPGADGGSAIIKYQYRVGNGAWTDAAGTSSPITVTGLTNYQTASIRLRAVNAVGNSPASVAVSVRPRQAGPEVFAAAASGSSGIVVTFNLNPLPGTTVAHQSVVAYAEGQTNTVRGSCRTYGKQTTCYIGGLTRGTTYDLRVTAHLPGPGRSWHNFTFEGSILQVSTNR
jgi:titin